MGRGQTNKQQHTDITTTRPTRPRGRVGETSVCRNVISFHSTAKTLQELNLDQLIHSTLLES